MTERETIEMHTTECIDKELPRIVYEKKIIHNMTESESIYISVSDKTSRAALTTLKEIREEMELSKRVCLLTSMPGGSEPGTELCRWR
jgi:hypothetical protein